jgi:DNA-binding MarR family transcriptional regulator
MKTNFENETQENLFRLVHRIRALIINELNQVDDRISVMHIRSLKYIAKNQPVTQRQLVENLRRDKGQVARLVNDMTEIGLLEKIPDENDRRSVNLNLTKDSKELLREYKKRENRKFRTMLKGIDETQIKQLNNLLVTMRENLS